MAETAGSTEPDDDPTVDDAGPSSDLNALQRRVVEILGHTGALITFSWSRYRRLHPTHLAVKNARILLEATGDEVWWGDLDLTIRTEALAAAARAAGQTLLVGHEWVPRGANAEPPAQWGDDAIVARLHPDGRIEVDPRAGYRRGHRLYRQTPAGRTRWERRFCRADPALISRRERSRILLNLSKVAPNELGAACREARLALVLQLDDDALVVSVPALACSGRGADIDAALASLARELAARASG